MFTFFSLFFSDRNSLPLPPEEEIQTCNEAFEMADKESRIKFMDEDDSTTTSEDEDDSTSKHSVEIFRISLPLRFYVKSILVIFELQTLPF